MSTATLTSKGQLTVPKIVRDALGLAAGDKVQFVAHESGFKLVAASQDVRELKGLFAGRRKKAATLAEIDAAIQRGATRRFVASGR